MGDVITYENLYEIVHKEKSNESLQKIKDKFPEQIAQYLHTKIEVYKESKQKKSPDLEKIRTQVLSVRRLVKSFYELRERKIANMAISKSRTKSNLDEEENLLDYEQKMLEDIKSNLDKYRKKVLLNLLNAKLPYSTGSDKEENKEKTEEKPQQQEKPILQEKLENHMVRFLLDVPKFLGKKKEIYGPFKPGDIANLDKDIVKILIQNQAVEIINTE